MQLTAHLLDVRANLEKWERRVRERGADIALYPGGASDMPRRFLKRLIPFLPVGKRRGNTGSDSSSGGVDRFINRFRKLARELELASLTWKSGRKSRATPFL